MHLGTLEARSYVNGELVSTDTLVTTGAPAKIVLRPEKTEISPDGHSLSYVAVEVTDESGLVVPDARCEITRHSERLRQPRRLRFFKPDHGRELHNR